VFRKPGQLRLKPLISSFSDQALHKKLMTLADPGSALMITLMISLMALVFELSVRVLKAHKLSVIVSSL
jgi:hypothetical protein